MHHQIVRRTLAALAALAAVVVGTALPAAAAPVIHGSCTPWTYVQPATNPTANDVLARVCWQTKTDVDAPLITYRRMQFEAYMPGPGTSRSLYILGATTTLYTGDPCGDATRTWGAQAVKTIEEPYLFQWWTPWLANDAMTNSPDCNVTRGLLHGTVGGSISLARNASGIGGVTLTDSSPTNTRLAF